MAYVISEDCVACGTCIGECPVEAISEGDIYKIDADASSEILTLSKLVGKEIQDLRNDLKVSILTNYLSTFVHDAVVKQCIAEERAKCIALISEQGEFGRSWVKVAKDYMISTVGMQHGVLETIGGSINLPYCCNVYSNSDKLEAYPIPDTMLVYGESDKDYLVSSLCYPPEKLIVTGNPR